MLPLDQIRGRHIAVCTPCFGGQVCQNYLMSVLKLTYACMQHKVTLSFIIRGGDSLIPRARNSMVAEFMATEGYTHLLWVDADIGFEPTAVFRLLQADRDVVAGLYPMKLLAWPETSPANMTRAQFDAYSTRYPFNPKDGQLRADADGFCEVTDAPTGFMLIRREVFVAMMERLPDHRIELDRTPLNEAIYERCAAYSYRFFDTMIEPGGRYLSEDYAFCRRWQSLGGKVHVDLVSNLTHQGEMLYEGNLLGRFV